MVEMPTLVKLLGSTVFAQFLLICISPILTRLYSPDVFGEFLVLISIVYIINSIALGRMDMAILSLKESEDLQQCFSLGVFFSITISFTSALFILFANNLYELPFHFYYIPVIVLVLSIYQLLISLFLREGNISLVSRNKVSQSFILGFGQISLGYISGNVYALIFSQVVSFFSLIFFNIRNFKKYLKKTDILKSIFKFKKYILYDAAGNFFQVFSNNIFPLLIGVVLGGYVGGLYYMAYRVVITPISIFSISVSQTIASKFTLNDNIDAWKKTNENALILMLSFFCIPFALASAYIEKIIPYVLGLKWSEAGSLISFFSTWMFLRLLYDSFSINLSLNNLSNIKMKIDLFVLILTGFLFFSLWYIGFNGVQFLKIFGYANLFIYLFALLFFCNKFLGCSWRTYFLIFSSSFFVFAYPLFDNYYISVFLLMVFLFLVTYLYKIKDRIFK